jgi:hypothetical protein
VRFGGESSYTPVALAATLRAPLALGRFRGQLRPGRMALWLAGTLALLVAALHVEAFIPGGADLADPAQRLYAANLWDQVQISLMLVSCFLPWLLYALLWRGAASGAVVLAAVGFAGTSLGTWLTLLTIGAYLSLPGAVTGVVVQLDGHTVRLDGARGPYYLALSEDQLRASSSWFKTGVPVLLWVSPRNQVGAVEPARAPGDLR